MDGKVISTPIIANNIAKLVKIPNIIVGTKFENPRVKNPIEIVIEVINTALPTDKCDDSIDSIKLKFLILLDLYLYK